jgi:hypothetical protein
MDDAGKEWKDAPDEHVSLGKLKKTPLNIRSLEERFAEDQGYRLFKPGCVREYGLRDILNDLQASTAPRWRLRSLLIRWYERK